MASLIEVQQVRALLWETVEIPQLQLVLFLDKLLHARCVQRQVPMVDDLAHFIDCCERPL